MTRIFVCLIVFGVAGCDSASFTPGGQKSRHADGSDSGSGSDSDSDSGSDAPISDEPAPPTEDLVKTIAPGEAYDLSKLFPGKVIAKSSSNAADKVVVSTTRPDHGGVVGQAPGTAVVTVTFADGTTETVRVTVRDGASGDATDLAEGSGSSDGAPGAITELGSGGAPADDITTDEGDIVDDPTKCWFAVSGAYFGYRGNGGSCGSTFPRTVSGRPIDGGERFDDCGGIFLNARAEPYRYRSGGGEIDEAIDKTFDSIAVAPGMHVEIKSGDGAVIYVGDGPYMALSTEWGTDVANLSAIFQPREPEMPGWMKAAFVKASYVLPRIPLWQAHFVKVSKIEGKRCE